MAVHFELLASNTMIKETGKKFKCLLEISLVKYTGTSISVQNNCIKLSGFGVNTTRLFLHREITRNILCREKFFNPENSFAGF